MVGSYSRPGVLQGEHGVLRLVVRLVGEDTGAGGGASGDASAASIFAPGEGGEGGATVAGGLVKLASAIAARTTPGAARAGARAVVSRVPGHLLSPRECAGAPP